MGLDVRILGPLEVVRDDARVELGGRQRALVAALALQTGTAVSVDRLVDAIWGDEPPATARHLVQVYVSQVRALLGEDAVETRGGAYALRAACDAARFADLLDAARGESSLARYDAALAEWRGRVLDGIPLAGDAFAETLRLEELRLAAIEERNELALEAGRHRELVPTLRRRVAEEPLRERLRSQLMRALYRSGRQADALAAYRDAYRYFADELGVEPSPELRLLERLILDHDAALAPPPEPNPGAPRPRPPAAAALVVAVAIVAAVVAVVSSRGGTARPHTAPGDIAVVDGVSGRVLESVRTAASPGVVSVGGDAAWIGDGVHGVVLQADRSTGRVVRRVRIGAPPHALLAVRRALWIADGFDGRLQWIAGGHVSMPFRPTPTSTGRTALVLAHGSIWAASQDGYLVALDPRTRRVRSRLRIGLSNDVAADAHGIWVAAATRDSLVYVDPSTQRVREIPIGGVPAAVAAGAGSVWAVTPDVGRVWRIDPARLAVTASIAAPTAPSELAFAGGRLWIGGKNDPILVAVDPASNRIVQTVALAEPAGALAGDGNRLWVTLPR